MRSMLAKRLYWHCNSSNLRLIYTSMAKKYPIDDLGLNILIAERDNETLQARRKKYMQKRMKITLLKYLETELENLDTVNYESDNSEDYLNPHKDRLTYLNDPKLYKLQSIYKYADHHYLKYIKRLCSLAIGKRILNIELKRKKIEYKEKMEKKQKIELYFRENRIKRFDYESLEWDKLEDNSLICRAYANGKGFIESDNNYIYTHEYALKVCNFLSVIKDVNKIFYANYTGISLHSKWTTIDLLFRTIWLPIAVFLALSITLPFISFPYEEIVLLSLLGAILLALSYISVRSYIYKPNRNNQMEETIEDVNRYFYSMNRKNANGQCPFVWSCHPDFLYLEVKFEQGFPKER